MRPTFLTSSDTIPYAFRMNCALYCTNLFCCLMKGLTRCYQGIGLDTNTGNYVGAYKKNQLVPQRNQFGYKLNVLPKALLHQLLQYVLQSWNLYPNIIISKKRSVFRRVLCL
ncbi:hypothetical protein EGR_02915 [Echinococcus granulosus]|uniref:Uncharacterized protein n=1 Tax=Echinococcus granulosus TaxID=6210 RepID=W6UM81_ECHGR|nr:hypothetical protein EGR_02915 [Echinococcus granulosus]EUB62163.1 hypothetical protein EGR_02915 [Echinococcus granulosus]